MEPTGGSDAGRSAPSVGAATGRGDGAGVAERGAGGRRAQRGGRARGRRQTRSGCRRRVRERPHAEDGCRRPAREDMPAEESPAAPCDSPARGGPWHARPGGTPAADATATRYDVTPARGAVGQNGRPSRHETGAPRNRGAPTLLVLLISRQSVPMTSGPSRPSRRRRPRSRRRLLCRPGRLRHRARGGCRRRPRGSTARSRGT